MRTLRVRNCAMRKSRRKRGPRNPCSSLTRAKHRMQYSGWHNERFQKPWSMVMNVGFCSASSKLRNPVVEDALARTKIMETRRRQPSAQGRKNLLQIQLIVKNQLAHGWP